MRHISVKNPSSIFADQDSSEIYGHGDGVNYISNAPDFTGRVDFTRVGLGDDENIRNKTHKEMFLIVLKTALEKYGATRQDVAEIYNKIKYTKL